VLKVSQLKVVIIYDKDKS